MATYTTNLNLKKPDTTDKVSIADINSNMDLIDAQIKANADMTSGKADDSDLIPKVNGTAGQVWTSGGDGTASWADASGGSSGSSGSSGGEVWEEVDLTNFPTDWEVGDRVRLGIRTQISGTASSWTVAPTTIKFNGNLTSNPMFIEFELIDDSVNTHIPFYMDYYTYYVIIGQIQNISGTYKWNTGNDLFTIGGAIFNGAGISRLNKAITPRVVGSHVTKMFRWRSHSGNPGSSEGGGAN